MAESVLTPSVSIAIDMKKSRIRIHKPTLHTMGDPRFFQLLFDPKQKVIAFRCVDHEVPGGQEVRVRPYDLRGENCFEVYSSMLVRKIRKVYGPDLGNHTYRFSGYYLPAERVAVFPMSTIQRYEPAEVINHDDEEIITHTGY